MLERAITSIETVRKYGERAWKPCHTKQTFDKRETVIETCIIIYALT